MIKSFSYADVVRKTPMHNKASSSAEKPKMRSVVKDTSKEDDSNKNVFNWEGLPEGIKRFILTKQFDDFLEFYASTHRTQPAMSTRTQRKITNDRFSYLKKLNESHPLNINVILTDKKIYHMWLTHIYDILLVEDKEKHLRSPMSDVEYLKKACMSAHYDLRSEAAHQEKLPSDCIDSLIYDKVLSVRKSLATNKNISSEQIKKILKHEINQLNDKANDSGAYWKILPILQNLIKNPVVPIEIIQDFITDDKNKEIMEKFYDNLMSKYITEKGSESSKVIKCFINDKHPDMLAFIRHLLDIYKKSKNPEFDDIQKKYHLKK